MRLPLLVAVLALTAGCAAKPAANLSWDFEAHPASGEVRVLPVLALYDAPSPRYDSYVTEGVPDWRRVLRQQRTEQVNSVPAEVASALPGAINAQLTDRWDGRFRLGRYPVGTRDRLAASVRSGRDLDPALSAIGRRGEGDAQLVTWVDELGSEPLTTLAFPGELVNTVSGPMYVDLIQEHHRVWANVGVALVASDGEVVMRMTRPLESVVSLRIDADDAARDMARELAHDMVLVWPDLHEDGGGAWAPAELAQR